jgi:membrane protease YdiL (CAAX protease family)
VLVAAVKIGLVVGVYAGVGGRAGLHELAQTMASLSLAQRAFFAVMGVRNAFFEETLFRGDLLRALEPRVGAGGAIVLSSAAFALYHRSLSPLPLLMKFVAGLLLGGAASRTRSLAPSGLAHALSWAILANA